MNTNTTAKPTNIILKEASFILPEFTPNGDEKPETFEELEEELLTHFAGFNSVQSDTVVKDPLSSNLLNDPTFTYTVFLEDKRVQTDRLKDIAVKYSKLMEQDFVMFKDTNGEITYI